MSDPVRGGAIAGSSGTGRLESRPSDRPKLAPAGDWTRGEAMVRAQLLPTSPSQEPKGIQPPRELQVSPPTSLKTSWAAVDAGSMSYKRGLRRAVATILCTGIAACGGSSQQPATTHQSAALEPGQTSPPFCEAYLALPRKHRLQVVRRAVGTTNLVLRTRGTAASCANWVHDGDGNTTSAVWVAKSVAAAWPSAAHVNLTTLPKSHGVADPDQCNERTERVNGGSNADYIAAGDLDCIVMGY